MLDPNQLGAGAALAAGFADSGDEGRHYTGSGQAAFAHRVSRCCGVQNCIPVSRRKISPYNVT